MGIAEVCPQCGAERPSWLGLSHRRHDWVNERYDAPVCDDGLSPEWVWRNMRFPNMALPMGPQSALLR
jgi:hypothetical protein